MPAVNCPVCAASVDVNSHVEHIEESHSDPTKTVAGGKTEAQFLRDHFSKIEAGEDEAVPVEKTAIPSVGVLEELGVKLEDLKNATVTTETGASLTAAEAKRVFGAIEALAGFRIDRGSFIVNFVDWGIRNSFTEELADAGGFVITSHTTVAHQEQYFKVSTMHTAINEYFASSGTGRSFTFRRFGRYLGRSIPTIIDNNPQLKKFYMEGSPMSNRLGVPAQDFLTVTSIFEYIKPYQKWTPQEKRAWEAHNRSVVKIANVSNTDFLPTDLRPSPTQASTLIETGANDFGRRHAPDYGRGASMFEDMIKRASTVKSDKGGLGYTGE